MGSHRDSQAQTQANSRTGIEEDSRSAANTFVSELNFIRRGGRQNLLLNSICFQGIWLVAVVIQQPWLMVVLMLLWMGFNPLSKGEVRAMLALAAVGVVVDQLLLSLGMYQFSGQSAQPTMMLPVWLVLLWVAFARFMLLFQQQVEIALPWLALLCVGGGTSSYFGAQQLGAVSIDWGIGVPLLLFIAWWGAVPYLSGWLGSGLGGRHDEP